MMPVEWPANGPDLSPNENLWWKLKKMAHDEAPTCRSDVELQMRERWSQIDEEYCLMIVKPMPRVIQAVIKARGGATKY